MDALFTLSLADVEPGQLVITEIMANPDVLPDVEGEWFEVFNASAGAVELQGLEVTDLGSNFFTVQDSLVVPSGEYAVLAATPSIQPLTTYVYFWSSFTLANSADEVRLSFEGVVFDEVIYGPSFPSGTGASIQLSDDLLDATANDFGSNWCLGQVDWGMGDLGTPGTSNDICPLP